VSLAEGHDSHQHNALVREQLLDTREQRRKLLRVLGGVAPLWIDALDGDAVGLCVFLHDDLFPTAGDHLEREGAYV